MNVLQCPSWFKNLRQKFTIQIPWLIIDNRTLEYRKDFTLGSLTVGKRNHCNFFNLSAQAYCKITTLIFPRMTANVCDNLQDFFNFSFSEYLEDRQIQSLMGKILKVFKIISLISYGIPDTICTSKLNMHL